MVLGDVQVSLQFIPLHVWKALNEGKLGYTKETEHFLPSGSMKTITCPQRRELQTIEVLSEERLSWWLTGITSWYKSK